MGEAINFKFSTQVDYVLSLLVNKKNYHESGLTILFLALYQKFSTNGCGIMGHVTLL